MNDINEKYSEILACKEYLNSTDYMIIKRSENGYAVPEEVLLNRSNMRERINTLQNEIKELELLKIQSDDNENNIL